MVSTRSHPQAFPEPDLSPSKQRPTRSGTAGWVHTTSFLALLWLWVSLPLVVWDTGYVLLRPLTMPGGRLHWPIYAPYKLYGTVDYIYGWKAFNERNGFTSAQGFMNIVETVLYGYYLYIVYSYGHPSTVRGAPKPASAGLLGEARYLEGRRAGIACLVLYSSSVMTFSKTALYWLNEYFSGYANIGHNSALNLILLWIIPNGPWLILSAYMAYVSGTEMLAGLASVGGTAPSIPENGSLTKSPVFKKE